MPIEVVHMSITIHAVLDSATCILATRHHTGRTVPVPATVTTGTINILIKTIIATRITSRRTVVVVVVVVGGCGGAGGAATATAQVVLHKVLCGGSQRRPLAMLCLRRRCRRI